MFIQQLNKMGIKRKLEDFEEGLEKNIGGQRQSILDISMFKLQTIPTKRRVEPSLLRSVLILNTLKRIENELQKEGVTADYSEAASITTLTENSDVAMDVLPEVENSADNFIQQDMSDLHIDSSSKSNLPSQAESSPPPQPQPRKEVASPLPPIETFVELSNAFASSANALSCSSLKMSSFHENSKDMISSFEQQHSFTLKSEDILGDVDISHCDFDIFSSLASSMKLTPLSAEEVMHSFPVHSGVVGESYSSIFNSCNTVSTTCKSDLLPEEIENIMQILVGT